MAGPVVAALGPYQFEAHGFGLTDIKRDLDTGWAKVPVAGGLDQLQWTGGSGDTVTIRGVLFPHVWGGLDQIEGLRQAAMDGQPLPLVTYSGGIHGQHIIEKIGEDRTFIDADGLPMRDAYSLSLRRYQVGATGGGRGGFSPLSIVQNLVNLFF